MDYGPPTPQFLLYPIDIILKSTLVIVDVSTVAWFFSVYARMSFTIWFDLCSQTQIVFQMFFAKNFKLQFKKNSSSNINKYGKKNQQPLDKFFGSTIIQNLQQL